MLAHLKTKNRYYYCDIRSVSHSHSYLMFYLKELRCMIHEGQIISILIPEWEKMRRLTREVTIERAERKVKKRKEKKKLTNVSFAFTRTYPLVKTFFIFFSPICHKMLLAKKGKKKTKLTFHHFWHTRMYLN